MRLALVAASLIAGAGCSARPLDLPLAGAVHDLGIPADMTLAPGDQAMPSPDLAQPVGPDLGSPSDLPPPQVATQVSAGTFFTCAAVGGGAKCWGVNDRGQLGNGRNINSPVPVGVVGLETGVLAVAAGQNHACALTGAGAVTCWGANDHGQLGNDMVGDSNVPGVVVGLTGIVAVASGADFSCALDGNGIRVRCWGDGQLGQLGNGSSSDSRAPVLVSGLDPSVTTIASGYGHTCAVLSGGGMKCWGFNSNGQLGNNSTSNSLVPVDVPGFKGVSLGFGGTTSCSVADTGAAYCWGGNSLGQLGDGNETDAHMPTAVAGITSGASAIFVGGSHSCAVVSGAVKCWGWNDQGQLGDGTMTRSDVPVNVKGLASGAVSGAAGAEHTCVVTTSGGIKCWGENYDGQLGDGQRANSLVPVDVVGL
jgi:alpha-tubulin suppressor-like RCC1 family protein